ncbi:MAG: hypothetical protein ABIJ14_00890 [Nanoarchaeota archaeon]|nr:hypothetical protein [Nanoarchaeota archaeon]
MNKWLEILIGLILIILSVYAWGMNLWGFGTAAIEFLKGGIIWIILMMGFLFIILGISDIKD